MPIKVFDRDVINEGSDAEYVCQFVGADAAEQVLLPAAIQAITATLKNVATAAVINSRNNQSVLAAAGGSLAGDGTFTLQLGALDNPHVAGDNEREEHRLTLKVTYTQTGGGTGHLNHEVRLFIQPLVDA